MIQLHSNKIVATLMALIVILTIFACSRNPVTGKKELMLMSESQEKNLGLQSDPSIVASYGLYEDEKMQTFINERGKQMAKVSHRPDLGYEFKILDSPVVNAFAVPGGYVYFTRGIMAHFNNEAEFAGVLGHEIGHITARHSASQYSKGMLAQVGLIAGLIVSKDFAQYADVASQGLQLLFLKFGRDDEAQSDKLGVEYSTKVGYDAHEMAGFFKTLDRMREGTGAESLPTFMSTHPDPADRFNKVNAEATKWQEGKSKSQFKVNRDSYLRMIDGLIYGEDPKQGYVENNNFYHPELKFQYPIPARWKVVNTPQQVQMAPNDNKALMTLSLGQGESLEAAAQAVVDQYKLKMIRSNKKQVNGLSALEVLADQQDPNNPQNVVRILMYHIEYNGLIYRIMGMAHTNDYGRFKAKFERTMNGFKKLTDQSKINVKPERIKIETVKNNGTFSSALQSFNMPSDRFNELAILNGMQLNEQVKRGMLIKTITK